MNVCKCIHTLHYISLHYITLLAYMVIITQKIQNSNLPTALVESYGILLFSHFWGHYTVYIYICISIFAIEIPMLPMIPFVSKVQSIHRRLWRWSPSSSIDMVLNVLFACGELETMHRQSMNQVSAWILSTAVA